jgi:predicted metal-dependent peptidase
MTVEREETMNAETLKLKIDQARVWAMQNQPFYGQLLMRLDHKFGPVGTARVNGKSITWDAEFLEKLTDEETRYVLIHETLHCAHQHLWRLPADKYGNMAGDYVIEKIMRTIQDVKQPANGLVCPVAFEHLAEEEIVQLLKKASEKNQEKPETDKSEQDDTQEDNEESSDGDQDESASDPQDEQGDSQEDGQESDSGDSEEDGQDGQGDSQGEQESDSGSDQGSGSSVAPGDAPGNDDRYSDSSGSFSEPEEEASENENLADEWKQHVVQSHFAAQMGKGSTPADMARQIERLRHQALDWRQELADFLKANVGQRNDWARAARRHAWQSVIYPKKREEIATVIFVRDTSLSIDNEMCGKFTTMGEACCAELGCRAILMDVDTDIHREDTIEPGSEWPLEALGGGGTSFCEPFRRAKEMVEGGERIAGIVYWTDLNGAFPCDWTEDVPTLWVASGKCSKGVVAPFGRTVEAE